MVILSFCSIGLLPRTRRHTLGSPHCLLSDWLWFVWFVWWIYLLITSPALTKMNRSSSKNESNPKQNGTDKQTMTMKGWDTVWELKFNLQIVLTKSLELNFPHTHPQPFYLDLLVFIFKRWHNWTFLDFPPNRVFNLTKHLGFTSKFVCFGSFHSGKNDNEHFSNRRKPGKTNIDSRILLLMKR